MPARKGLLNKAWWQRFGGSVKYAFHVMFHPFDGFWDLTHEHRGTLAAANFFVILLLLSRLMSLQLTNIMFMKVYWPRVNIFQQCASLLLPLGIYCGCNWGLTTLFDGKGTLKDVYIATAYALVPYILGQLIIIPLSNILTMEEGSLYTVIETAMLVWSALLLVCGMVQVHDFGLGKTLLFLFLTVVGMAIVIFLLLLFLTLVGDGIGYIISVYKEINFRLN
ncbi:MAG: YIP1 family protein [Clostridia bacterium]|nr:YIP1 family protein [Clostridia bacterium]